MKELYANVIGEGKPLLILHGFLGMSDNWKTPGKRFAENGYQVHLIDQRNHGRSFWSEEFSYDLMADDLDVYIQKKELETVDLLGHSMGGKTAMNFACGRPEKVEKLLIADIGPRYYPPHHQHIINGLKSIPLNEMESRVQADEILSKHISDPGIRQFLLKNLYWKEKGRHLSLRFNLDVLSEKLEEIGAALPEEARFGKPTLFLYGERSDYITPEDKSLILNQFPEAHFARIAYAGHWLHAENPGDFMEAALSFLNEY